MEQRPENDSASFHYDGYQVVRGEYFAHLAEPSITFNRYRVYLNTACLRKAAVTTFVQILVNPEAQKMVVRPCGEDEKDSFAWCTAKRKPKQIVCRMFFAKMMDFMHWDPNYRYKLLGKQILSGGERLFIFDLTSAVVFPRPTKIGSIPEADQPDIAAPRYPEAWKSQFGLPVEAHRKVFQINLFDKFAVFSVQQTPKGAPPTGENNFAGTSREEDSE